MSVPRPAMLVAIVTARGAPACAIISASRSCCFAFQHFSAEYQHHVIYQERILRLPMVIVQSKLGLHQTQYALNFLNNRVVFYHYDLNRLNRFGRDESLDGASE